MATKPEIEKVLKHLQQKWGDTRSCPMCGKGPWNVSDSIFQLLEYNQSGLVLGGPVVPVVPVTCLNCGNAILVNAIVAGAVKPATSDASAEKQPEAKPEAPK